jgi:polyisoprenoid-binding protein YceI
MSWQLDLAHSEIQFKVRHMMVGWTRGQFEKFSGSVHLDEQHPENSSVEITIDANSINTRQADRDGHLRSPDFLDVAGYPTVSFKSTKVEPTGPNTAKLTGDLTIRDITHSVTLDVEHAGVRRSPFGPFLAAGFSAETVISRKAWNLTWNSLIEGGGVLVGDDIHISVEVELNRAAEAQEAVATPA